MRNNEQKTTKTADRQKQMLEEPLNKTILKMAAPTIMAFLISSIYSLADTYFVSSLGTSATAAITVNSSLDQIILLGGSMLAMGANSYVARLLGMGNHKKASQVLSTAYFSALGFGSIILIVGSTFMTPMVRLLGATATSEQYSIDYATYILLAAPFMAGNYVLNQCLRSEGSAMFSMIGMGAGGASSTVFWILFLFSA